LSRAEIGVVRCLGLNYADHAAEANMQKPAYVCSAGRLYLSLIFFQLPYSVLQAPHCFDWPWCSNSYSEGYSAGREAPSGL
jgi:hypothetical protein